MQDLLIMHAASFSVETEGITSATKHVERAGKRALCDM